MSHNESFQKGMIITDDFSRFPVLDFEAYTDVIVNIILKSYPKFSIGIYGEWGKTTLMKSVERTLSRYRRITCIWFNAWRYEREEQFALIPLLKVLAYNLPDKDNLANIKAILKKAGIGVLRNADEIISPIIGNYLGHTAGEKTGKVVGTFTREIANKIEGVITEIDRDTIYFDGLTNIENEMRKIVDKDPQTRIVVFVDDLDRCSPRKVLEVLESIKVFLGIDGFVYVIGLSYETLSRLITSVYKESGINGQDYIKKLIQIPVSLPEWNREDIIYLINSLLSKGVVGQLYQPLIKRNIELISKVIEPNPREIKRFINKFVVAYEVIERMTEEKVIPEELLLMQSINLRWNKLYQYLVSSAEFRDFLFKLAKAIDSEGLKEVYEMAEDKAGKDFRNRLEGIVQDTALWQFIRQYESILSKISNWELYRRAIFTSKEFISGDRVAQVVVNFDRGITIESAGPFLSKLYTLLEENKVRIDGHMLASPNSIVIMVHDPYSRSTNARIVKSMSSFLEDFNVSEINAKHDDGRLETVWKRTKD